MTGRWETQWTNYPQTSNEISVSEPIQSMPRTKACQPSSIPPLLRTSSVCLNQICILGTFHSKSTEVTVQYSKLILPAQFQSCQLSTNPASSVPILPAKYQSCQLSTNPATSVPILPAQFQSCQLSTNPASSIPILPAQYQSCLLGTIPAS